MPSFNGSSINSTTTEPSLYNGMTLTRDQQYDIYILRVSMGCFTLLGCIFVFLSVIANFKRFHGYRKMYYRLVLGLTVGAFLEGISSILNLVVFGNNGLCILQAVLLQFSQNTIFCFTTVIAVNLYMVVCKDIKVTIKWQLVFYGVVWIWLLFTTFLPFASNAYGPAGAWCWITETSGQPYRWGVFYVPLIIQAIVIIVLFYKVIKSLKFNLNYDLDYKEKSLKKTIRKLIVYPIILIVHYIFPFVNRIHDAVSPTDSFFLYVMQSITSNIYGFVVAITYGIDIEMKDRWIALLKRNLPFGYVSGDVVVDIQIVSDTITENQTEEQDLNNNH